MSVLPSAVSGVNCFGFARVSIFDRLIQILRQLQTQNELSISKALDPLIDDISKDSLLVAIKTGPQIELWNKPIADLKYKWSSGPWYFVETYFYRRIFDLTDYYSNGIDVFRVGKEDSLNSSMSAVTQLFKLVEYAICQNQLTEDIFKNILYMSLWGNKADLSLKPTGFDSSHLLFQVNTDEANILIDHSEMVFALLNSKKPFEQISFVIDNSGLDVITDLALATVLTKFSIAKRFVFCIKQDPIFVSDVTSRDFWYTFDKLSQNPETSSMVDLWRKYIDSKTWIVEPHFYWNTYAPLWELPEDIKNQFQQSGIVFLKGDALARRVHGDLRWDFTQKLQNIISNFPSPMVMIRTLKSETASGLDTPTLNNLNLKYQHLEWLSNGKYGVIQYLPK
eukprot:TRINITY_DN21621_c0_g1_i1.p1 TRINITY_DN21621_c0_g1~~TRINITY_DN21621_c0_g1_i1.p1  ORF type:complete len:394 (+),score=82.49 TRINITY_DN21621_c0_g1_i1:3-1184(+)